MPAAPVLAADRLILRPWRASDREAFAALNADPVVMEFLPAILSRAESDAFADRIDTHFTEHGFGFWAVAATALFGIAHGYAHGGEMPLEESPLVYFAGFVLTTAGLHIVGAVGGLLIMDHARGAVALRMAGGATGLAGLVLVLGTFGIVDWL